MRYIPYSPVQDLSEVPLGGGVAYIFSAHVGPTNRLKLAAAEARHATARLSLGWSNAVLRLSVFRLIGPSKGTTQGYRGLAFCCHLFGGADATMPGQGDR